MSNAPAHNAPQVGYYKYTARTPAHLLAIEPLLTSIGFVRLPSFRIKPVGRASQPPRHAAKIKPARSNKTRALKIPAELIPGSGLNIGMLERLFESLGIKLTTVKAVKARGLKIEDGGSKRPRRHPPSSIFHPRPPLVTHSHYEQKKKAAPPRRRRGE